ncbi:MAG: redox-regulated ATPase YchF, partial [Planctomycetaceae bacterium]|nr:redox-regulated ATPase YchF [Planctomycetaceae bacterium]
IIQVVRCFEDDDVIHVAGAVNPLADIDVVRMELLLADMQVLENALPKAQRAARTGDKEAKQRVEVLEACLQHVNSEQPIRTLELDAPSQKIVQGYGLMTAKPILFVANVSEDDLDGTGPLVQQVREFAAANGAGVVAVCAKLEAEIAELDEADRQEMLESVGLAEPALAVLAREAYRTLGLQSYFTAGPKEVRAWTIPIGATAPQAAGVIHSDFERGFIRVEVFSVDDLQTYKSEVAIKQAGKLRVEGKAYIMHDGDVCHFLFNV